MRKSVVQLLIGLVLALAAGRVLTRLRTLYEREQHSRHALSRALQTKTDFIADAFAHLKVIGLSDGSFGGRLGLRRRTAAG